MVRISLEGKKKNKGKQKINIEKKENKNNLHVTFSKRRNGIFKKAAELCVLCGAQVAIVVFSPGQNVYTFGHPNVEEVIHSFLNNTSPSTRGSSHRSARQLELNNRIMQLENEIADEEKIKHSFHRSMMESQSQRWWEAPVEELSLEQLQELSQQWQIFEANKAQKIESMAPSEVVASLVNGGSSSSVGVGVGGTTSAIPFHVDGAGAGAGGSTSAIPFHVDGLFNNACANCGNCSLIGANAPNFSDGGGHYIFDANSGSYSYYAGGGGGAPSFNGGDLFDTANINVGSSSFIGGGGYSAPTFHGGISLEPGPSVPSERIFIEPRPNNERIPSDANITGAGGSTNLREVGENEDLFQMFQNLK